MTTQQTLTRHRDIQNWVASRHGLPAIRRVPNPLGQMQSRLTLSFAKHSEAPKDTPPAQDDGMSPVSWTAWLAELDRQQLALKVIDQQQPSFEFVARRNLN